MGPLGMIDGSITNGQITASSIYSNRNPYDGRLKGGGHWATAEAEPSNPWIQVAFSSTVTIAAIQTQGHSTGREYWVIALQVQAGDSQNTLSYIKDGNGHPIVSIPKKYILKALLVILKFTSFRTPIFFIFRENVFVLNILIKQFSWKLHVFGNKYIFFFVFGN